MKRINLRVKREIKHRAANGLGSNGLCGFSLWHHAEGGCMLGIPGNLLKSATYSTSKTSFPVRVPRVVARRVGNRSRTLCLRQWIWESRTRRLREAHTNPLLRGKRRKRPGSHLRRPALYTFGPKKTDYPGRICAFSPARRCTQ